MSEKELPIVGDSVPTLYNFWEYLFTTQYNNYIYSHDEPSDRNDDYDHGNTAVWITSKKKFTCSCAEGWEFGNVTWFIEGPVTFPESLENPGSCCNFLVDPRCGNEPFGHALWCPVDLASCHSSKHTTGDSEVQEFLEEIPDRPETAALLANNLTHWSFCTTSFSDFLTMDGKFQGIVPPPSRPYTYV